jgi:HAD superfamily hydrolase (TIGR01509 family)
MVSLSAGQFQAFLFDLNGTLVADGPYHRQAFEKFFSGKGLRLSKEDLDGLVGSRRNDEIMRQAFGAHLSVQETDLLAQEKEALYRELYAPHVQEVPGAVAFVRQAKERGLPVAIASNGPRANAEFLLGALGIADAFDLVLCGEDLPFGKPDPRFYREVASRLGVSPANSLVFEDSPVGIQASVEAGCQTLGIATILTLEKLQELGTKWAVADFRGISLGN